MSSPRRAAREQALPPGEAALLRSLDPARQRARAAQLFHAGWTLQSVGDALEPPRARSTVRSWVARAARSAPAPVDAALPRPRYRTPASGYQRRTARPRPLDPAEAARVASLAPLARRYRARSASDSAFAVANRELTQLCLDLHADHVSVADLARAAGVTYRAMARRLGRTPASARTA